MSKSESLILTKIHFFIVISTKPCCRLKPSPFPNGIISNCSSHVRSFVYTSTRKLSVHSDAIWLLALLYIKLCLDCEKRSISVHHRWRI
ncbi:hypothetical protein Hdeb2414_s0016g00494851 [Helianthus debilis subsp. tardiflorus]